MKKIFALVLTLALMFTFTAFADIMPADEAIPSKTAEDLGDISDYETLNGTAIEPDFAIIPEILNEDMVVVMEDMVASLDKEGSVVAYFPVEVQNEIAAMLPETVPANSLITYAIMASSCINYKDAYGDVASKISIPAVIEDNQNVVVIVGFMNADGTWEWICIPSIVVDGDIEVVFDAATLARMETQQAMLVVLGDSIA